MGLFSFLFKKKKKSKAKKSAPEIVYHDEDVLKPLPEEDEEEIQLPKRKPRAKKIAPAVTKNVAKPEEPVTVTEKAEVADAVTESEITEVVTDAEVADAVTEEAEYVEITGEVETVTESRPTRSGRFDIKRTKDNRFVFNLYSSNKVLIATSQTYSSSQSALNGVKSVMTNAKKAEIEDLSLKVASPKPFPKWEIYIDKAGEYRYRLLATNGQCLTHAKAGYAHKSSCKRAISSIVRLANDAEVEKSYLAK